MNDITYVKRKFINYIDNIIINNKISHAYLIEIDNYDSDYDYIISFIKMILSNMKYEDVINSNDKIFKLIDSDNYPDIITISTDGSVIKKSSMIDLQKEFSNKSLYNNKKIYIIKEAEKLNDSSANTILKFLEEPEENIIAFLITNNRYNVIDTILSRCQIISIKEDGNNIDYRENIFDLMQYILNPRSFFYSYNDIMKNYYSDKQDFKCLIFNLENVFLCYLNNNYDLDSRYKMLLNNYSDDFLVNIISIIENEIPKLEYNVNYKLFMDSLFIKLLGG